MADRTNYLLGYGEKLSRRIPPPHIKPLKTHPYTFEEAKRYLGPRIRVAAQALDGLPTGACPNDEAVVLVTLHPSYLAKSYFPGRLLEAGGLRTVGSRMKIVRPRTSIAKRASEPTAQLFVAGSRTSFRELAGEIEGWDPGSVEARQFCQIEDLQAPSRGERVRSVHDKESQLYEAVLHARPDRMAEGRRIVSSFGAYLTSLGIEADLEDGIQVEGLFFVPVRVGKDQVPAVADYSFLRVLREMPALRLLDPVVRGYSLEDDCQPSEGAALDPGIRVAVFDGGIPSTHPFRDWVDVVSPPGIGPEVPEYVEHGSDVTSAVLFGQLAERSETGRPYCRVEHHRVLDQNTKSDPQVDLFPVLKRIIGALRSKRYDFLNLSIGPQLPVEDDDIHVWTAVLDQFLSTGGTLAAVAVGNGGENDRASGNARVQVPSDCVNALAIGAADTNGSPWKRARYSSIGPGRSPGFVKPDALAFGGSQREPFVVIKGPGKLYAQAGTSFAAPNALRCAIGVRAILGPVVSALAARAVLIHGCDPGPWSRDEVGWGRLPEDPESLLVSDDSAVHVLFQGELEPASWVQLQIPLPDGRIEGKVRIRATLCFATDTDPQDPVNYTRSGVEAVFRPNSSKRAKGAASASSVPLFSGRLVFPTEQQLRRDAHKWETTLCVEKRYHASSLNGPTLDLHYNAREGGGAAQSPSPIRYALIVTVQAPRRRDLYNSVVRRYAGILVPLRPVIHVPVQV